MKKAEKKSVGVPIFLYVLIFMLLISSYLLSSILAKFRSGSEGDGAGRVADFRIEHIGSDKTQLLVDMSQTVEVGGERINFDDYEFYITNYSEVDITFDLRIQFPQTPEVQDWMKLQVLRVDDTTGQATLLKTIQGRKGTQQYVFSKVDTIKSESETNAAILNNSTANESVESVPAAPAEESSSPEISVPENLIQQTAAELTAGDESEAESADESEAESSQTPVPAASAPTSHYYLRFTFSEREDQLYFYDYKDIVITARIFQLD